MDDYNSVQCPICGKHLKVINNFHLKSHGYDNKKSFLEDYPNTRMMSVEYEKFNAKLHGGFFKEYNKTSVQRERASNHCKQLNSNSILQSQKAKKRIYTEEDCIKRSEIMKSLYATGVMKYVPTYGKRHIYKISDDNVLCLRSFLECRAVSFLIHNNFEFTYETLRIPYKDSTNNYKQRIYIPDFYLPKYNLIIEVKPKPRQDLQISIDKKNACLELNYNYMFISKDDLDNYNNILEIIYALDTK